MSDVNVVGWLIGKENLLKWQDMRLPAVLDSADSRHLVCINAFIHSAFLRDGWQFVETMPIADWSNKQIADFARCLPFCNDVWRWLSHFGAEVERDYWKSVRGFLREPNPEDVHTAARFLMEAGRAFTAIDLVYGAVHQKVPLSTEFIAQILEDAMATEAQKTLGRRLTFDMTRNS